jgi:hypothetical protein
MACTCSQCMHDRQDGRELPEPREPAHRAWAACASDELATVKSKRRAVAKAPPPCLLVRYCARIRAQGADPDAKARAEELLVSYLSPEQAADFEEHRAFDVRGSNGGLYRLYAHPTPYASAALVAECGANKCTVVINVWPDLAAHLPGDVMLAVMLHLVNNEPALLAKGCRDLAPLSMRGPGEDSYARPRAGLGGALGA